MSEVELEDDEQEVLSQDAEEQDVHEEESLTEAPLPAEGVTRRRRRAKAPAEWSPPERLQDGRQL